MNNVLTVLVVDDREHDRDTLSRYLKEIPDWDFEVREARNLSETREVLGDQPVDVLILDHKLSSETGLEILGEEVTDDLPVVVVSGHLSSEEALQVYEEGAYTYLEKDNLSPNQLKVGIGNAIYRQELEESQQELRRQQELELMGSLAAKIMHKINNPNSVIKGNVEYLRKQLVEDSLDSSGTQDGGDLPPGTNDVANALEEIENASGTIEKIVDNVREYISDIYHDEERGEVIPLRPWLERTLEELGDQNDWSYQWQVTGDSVAIHASRKELRKAIRVMVENTLESVDGVDPKIEMDIRDAADEITLRYRDNGTQIPDSQKEFVFRPFYTTKSIHEGMGLGLTLVEDVVKDLGGQVSVRDSELGGVEFTMTLPKSVRVTSSGRVEEPS